MNGDVWQVGDDYEAYVGRWSRRVATEFVRWIDVPPERRWLDAGCGTGALSSAIISAGAAGVVGLDPSRGFLRSTPDGARAVAGDAAALPLRNGRFDAVVSGLSLNFVPRPEKAIAEFVRVAAPGAVVAAYVWDYAAGMRMMRLFWDVAAEVVPAAADHDEGSRFPICQEAALRTAWAGAGLVEVSTRPIEIPTVFAGFDDFWLPFLGGQGAAPAYLATLGGDVRAEIRERLRSRLPTSADGTIALTATAWAVRGRRPGEISPARRMVEIGIVQAGDPAIRATAHPFDLPREAPEAQAVVERLRATADRVVRAYPFAKGMGLAAPQIGIDRAAAVVRPVAGRSGPAGGELILLNPRVVDESPQRDVQYEGCLSFFDVRGEVERPTRIAVAHQQPDGHAEITTFHGETARMVQHEIDHLHGRLYTDRMPPGTSVVPLTRYARIPRQRGR